MTCRARAGPVSAAWVDEKRGQGQNAEQTDPRAFEEPKAL